MTVPAAPNLSNAIEFIDVAKKFGAVQVLTSINLGITRGDKVVICGPSGSGKSTLIRCVNGLERPTKGEVRVLGARFGPEAMDAEAKRIRAKVGMVFQSFNLFPHLSVLENIVLAPIQVCQVGRPEAVERGAALLKRVGLAEKENEFPARLSGGQQQRVAIARALAMQPEIMLFDEPTSALDPAVISEVLDIMSDLAGEGMTMLIVTHEMNFARRIADRILFLDQGSVVEDAPPEQFFNAPVSQATRSFLSKIMSH